MRNDRNSLRNVLIFSVIALGCGWLGRLVDLKVPADENGSLGQLIWIVSPLLAMVILRTFLGDGWKDFGLRANFRANLSLYVISIVLIPSMTLFTINAGHSFGWVDTSNLSTALLLSFGSALVPMLIKNIFEEFAWRGYLAPRLFSLGINRLVSHIYVGVIWALWHVPYLTVLVSPTEDLVTYIPRVVIGLVVMSVVYGEIRYVTGSVWPAVLLHTIGNALVDTLLLKKYIDIQEGYEYLVTPSPEGIGTIILTACVGLWLYQRNTSRTRST